ncbi:unnamed protein product, partial [Meganyctiphanes norvegica]
MTGKIIWWPTLQLLLLAAISAPKSVLGVKGQLSTLIAHPNAQEEPGQPPGPRSYSQEPDMKEETLNNKFQVKRWELGKISSEKKGFEISEKGQSLGYTMDNAQTQAFREPLSATYLHKGFLKPLNEQMASTSKRLHRARSAQVATVRLFPSVASSLSTVKPQYPKLTPKQVILPLDTRNTPPLGLANTSPPIPPHDQKNGNVPSLSHQQLPLNKENTRDVKQVLTNAPKYPKGELTYVSPLHPILKFVRDIIGNE